MAGDSIIFLLDKMKLRNLTFLENWFPLVIQKIIIQLDQVRITNLILSDDPKSNDAQVSEMIPKKESDILIPHIIKYMGSKKPILNFITYAIQEITSSEQWVCDLLSGSCSISAALRKQYNFISNDVQAYSDVLAHTYFSDLSSYNFETIFDQITPATYAHVAWFKENFKEFFFDYSLIDSIEEYQRIELLQRKLFLEQTFNIDYYLFTKFYSGTYWSFEQCVWIDSLRKASEIFQITSIYPAILSSIMHAMSYTTQSTGHFAQYRDGISDESVENIITYRQKNLFEIFTRKLKELIENLDDSLKQLKTTTLSFEECLKTIPENSTVYADPPYAPVHYSRFYHALETLVKYDYPKIDHKGRYRNDRHQSPFSQKSNAIEAFELMFKEIINKNSQMILSYSNSGVVDIEVLKLLAQNFFTSPTYSVLIKTLDHQHSTMGRFEDAGREVKEYLIIAKHI